MKNSPYSTDLTMIFPENYETTNSYILLIFRKI